MNIIWAPGRAIRCIFRGRAALSGAEVRPRKDAAAIPGAKALHLLWAVFAFRALWQFFENPANDLISPRGRVVLSTPHLKAQVDAALELHRKEGRHGPVVVSFEDGGIA